MLRSAFEWAAVQKERPTFKPGSSRHDILDSVMTVLRSRALVALDEHETVDVLFNGEGNHQKWESTFGAVERRMGDYLQGSAPQPWRYRPLSDFLADIKEKLGVSA